MEGGGIHFVMGPCQSRVTFLAGLWFFGLFGIEGMRGVTTVTFELDVMASFAKGFFQRIRKRLVLGMVFDSVPGDRMPSLPELIKLFFMALGAGLGLND
jgi:hypothetical protein